MQYETGNIGEFLQTAYSDEDLAALLAHAEDGRLSFYSCCCVAGLPSSGHALKSAGEYEIKEHRPYPLLGGNPLAERVSNEYYTLGFDKPGWPYSDDLRRERIIPLIRAEQERRAQSSTSILDAREEVTVA